MNGEEKRFFEAEFIKLKTQFSERWKAHELRSDDFRAFIKDTFEMIQDQLSESVNKINDLPCDLHQEKYKAIKDDLKTIKTNDLKHINIKINALLFTVLGSVFVAILVLLMSQLTK